MEEEKKDGRGRPRVNPKVDDRNFSTKLQYKINHRLEEYGYKKGNYADKHTAYVHVRYVINIVMRYLYSVEIPRGSGRLIEEVYKKALDALNIVLPSRKTGDNNEESTKER